MEEEEEEEEEEKEKEKEQMKEKEDERNIVYNFQFKTLMQTKKNQREKVNKIC